MEGNWERERGGRGGGARSGHEQERRWSRAGRAWPRAGGGGREREKKNERCPSHSTRPPLPLPSSSQPSLAALTAPRKPPDPADPAAPFTGSAVEWALRRVDGALDAAEADPPPGAKAVLDAARGPAGSAVGAAVGGVASAAARGAVAVGGTALKAALPVGKTVLAAGFRAAVGLVVKGGGGGDTKKKKK